MRQKYFIVFILLILGCSNSQKQKIITYSVNREQLAKSWISSRQVTLVWQVLCEAAGSICMHTLFVKRKHP